MLTQKQEAFVIKYLECGNATESYRHAYDTQGKESTINNNAVRLLKNTEITHRIQEHRRTIASNALSSIIIDKAFITQGILDTITRTIASEDNANTLKGYDMLGKMYDLNEDKQNDRLFTGAERLALVENYKKRLLDVTPES